MSKKIFVSGLSNTISQQEIGELFGAYGEVVAIKVICDYETGRSRGFGFIEMDCSDSASRAIEQLNGHELDGKTLAVNKARERTPREPRHNISW